MSYLPMPTQLNQAVQKWAQFTKDPHAHAILTVQTSTLTSAGWLVVQAAQRGVREAVLERQTVTRAILGLAELHNLQSECRCRRQ